MRIPRRWVLGPLVVYWLAMFVATHLPAARVPHVPVCDKTEHFVGFFGLSLLLANELSFRFRSGRADWLVLLIVALYAAGDEWTQQYVGRGTDLLDWYADMAGASVALILWGGLRSLVAHFRPQRRVDDINELATSGCNVDQKLDARAARDR